MAQLWSTHGCSSGRHWTWRNLVSLKFSFFQNINEYSICLLNFVCQCFAEYIIYHKQAMKNELWKILLPDLLKKMAIENSSDLLIKKI
jgi:hypothetical protein